MKLPKFNTTSYGTTMGFYNRQSVYTVEGIQPQLSCKEWLAQFSQADINNLRNLLSHGKVYSWDYNKLDCAMINKCRAELSQLLGVNTLNFGYVNKQNCWISLSAGEKAAIDVLTNLSPLPVIVSDNNA